MRSENRKQVFRTRPEWEERESLGRSERYTFQSATLLGRFWDSGAFYNLVIGGHINESRLVFPNTRGNMVHNMNLQNSLYRIFGKAGIAGATMHTLRHTYATRCFEAGVDIKAISEQLGHANVKTTYNIYVHLLEDTKEKEIDKLQGIDKLLA